MSLKYPELKLLSDFLRENTDLAVQLLFREVSEADNRNALRVECVRGPGEQEEELELTRRLARFWGCPEAALPDISRFEAGDRWHGAGEGNLRDMADELGKEYEPFFDLMLTVEEIHEVAALEHEPIPRDTVIIQLEPTYEEYEDQRVVGLGPTVLQALADLEKNVIAYWGKDAALSDNHLLQAGLDLEELGIPGTVMEFSDMSCPEDAFRLRRMFVDDPYHCANCDHVDEHDDLPEAKDIALRCEPGDAFSDVECPHCHALCFPAPEFKYEPK